LGAIYKNSDRRSIASIAAVLVKVGHPFLICFYALAIYAPLFSEFVYDARLYQLFGIRCGAKSGKPKNYKKP